MVHSFARSLVQNDWAVWYLKNQVAGYFTTYSKPYPITFTTIKVRHIYALLAHEPAIEIEIGRDSLVLVAPTGQRPHGAAVQAGAGLRHVLGLLGRHLAAAQVAPPPSPSPSCARSFIACSTGTLSAAAVVARVNQARASAPCRSHSLACFAARTASHRPSVLHTHPHGRPRSRRSPATAATRDPSAATAATRRAVGGAQEVVEEQAGRDGGREPRGGAGVSLVGLGRRRCRQRRRYGAWLVLLRRQVAHGLHGPREPRYDGPHDSSSSTLAHTYTHSISISIAGATCYLNSLLQHLYLIPEFRHALFSWRFEKTDERRSNKDGAEAGAEAEVGASSIPYQLQRLFAQLELTKRKAVNTKALTRSFGWTQNDAFMQQDAQVRFVVSVHMIDRSTNRSN